MPLIFRVEPTHNIPRVTVLRERFADGKRATPLLLGSFNEKKTTEHIAEKLSTDELYELENFKATIDFAKQEFGAEVNELDRFITKVAPDYKTSLLTIWETAQEYGIDYTPEHEMLVSLLNRSKLVEQQLKVLTGGEFSALSAHNVTIEKQLLPKSSLKNSKALMQAAFDLPMTLSALVDEFNDVAVSVGKRAKFSNAHLATLKQALLKEDKEMFPKWYYAIALTVLSNNNIDVTEIVPTPFIIKNWLRLNKESTYHATFKKFKKMWPQLAEDSIAQQLILKKFIDDELISAASLPKESVPTPAYAIERWVNRRWRKQEGDENSKVAIAEFKKLYPLSGKNSYIVDLIKQYASKICH